MLLRWLTCVGVAVVGCSSSAGTSSGATMVIEQPPETINTLGLDCERKPGPQKSLPEPLLERLRNDAERAIDDLLTTLRAELPVLEALVVTSPDCGVQNAFYRDGRIELCRELFSNVAALWFDPNRGEAENTQRILGAWRYVFFHEVGHALIDLSGWTVSEEEDAVDGFSTLELIEAGLADDALSAAGFWRNKTKAGIPCMRFQDEHALSQKRFESIVCLVYGSDPSQLDELVAQYELEAQQLCICPFEHKKQRAAWRQLLDEGSIEEPCGELETACCSYGERCQPGLECAAGMCSATACE